MSETKGKILIVTHDASCAKCSDTRQFIVGTCAACNASGLAILRWSALTLKLVKSAGRWAMLRVGVEATSGAKSAENWATQIINADFNKCRFSVPFQLRCRDQGHTQNKKEELASNVGSRATSRESVSRMSGVQGATRYLFQTRTGTTISEGRARTDEEPEECTV